MQAKASNTINLSQHLKEHHPTLFAEIAPKVHISKQPSPVIASTSKYSLNSAQIKELKCAAAYYLAVPLNPGYDLPSRKHFIMPVLRQAVFYSATADLWTSGASEAWQ